MKNIRKPGDAERCALCNCKLYRGRAYATPTIEGRSHATKHHYVATRFFKSRGALKPIYDKRDFKDMEIGVFCYECHEELLHNPIVLKEEVAKLQKIIKHRGLGESCKLKTRNKIKGRIELFRKIISRGIDAEYQDVISGKNCLH